MPRKKNPKIPKGVFEKIPGSGVYWARYRDQDGELCREQAGSLADAEALYVLRRAQVHQGTFDRSMLGRKKRLPKNGQMFVADAIDRYLAESKATKLSARDDERYGRYWKAAFGPHKRLADITVDEVKQYRRKRLVTPTRRGRPPRPATVNRCVAFLRRVFNVMLEEELVDRNPVAKVEDLPEENEQTDLLEDRQQDVLSAMLTAPAVVRVDGYTRRDGRRVRGHEIHYKRNRGLLDKMIELAIHTGLRQGEQLRIRREHVMWDHATLKIPRNKKRKQRTVKLNSRALELLREQFATHESPWLYPSPKDPKKHRSQSGLERAWANALQRAGLPHIRWHSLRATFTTRMLEEGADWEDVRDQLGHSTLETVRRYARLVEDRQRASLERLVSRRQRREDTRTGPGDTVGGDGDTLR